MGPKKINGFPLWEESKDEAPLYEEPVEETFESLFNTTPPEEDED